MAIDLKAKTAVGSFDANCVLFGATATGATAPDKFTAAAVLGFIRGQDHTWTGQQTFAIGTLTASKPFAITQTWNSSGVTFTGLDINITDTASAAASIIQNWRVGGTSVGSITKAGAATFSSTIRAMAGQILAPNGDGSLPGFAFGSATGAGLSYSTSDFSGNIRLQTAAGTVCSFNTAHGVMLENSRVLGWTSNIYVVAPNTRLTRVADGIVGVRANSNTAGGAMNFVEQTAPAAPSADQVVIYAEDNGAGKTRFMARFATGAAQQIAIEP